MSPDSDPLEAPTALPGLQKHPALIIGLLVSLLNAIISVAGLGAFDDGLQTQDILLILTPFLAGLATKTQVFPQATVDRIAPRSVQRRAVREKRRRSPILRDEGGEAVLSLLGTILVIIGLACIVYGVIVWISFGYVIGGAVIALIGAALSGRLNL